MCKPIAPACLAWLACTLALKDWLFERTLSLCAVLALASMLTPLLVLNGVRVGFVENLRHTLLQDPTALIIMPAGSGSAGYTKAQLHSYQTREDVRFVTPRTRAVAAELQFALPDGQYIPLSLEPTHTGDPLLARGHVLVPDVALPVSNVVLSAAAAQKLCAVQGQEITARLGRRTPEGKLESHQLTFVVSGILPPGVTSLEAVFMPLEVLEDIQDYRDYVAVPRRHFHGDTLPESERRYESFRLYARSMEDVETLDAYFASQHIPVITKAKNVADIRMLDAALSRIIMVIALAVALGFVAFTVSSAHAAVRRKDKMLGMLRLLGFTRFALMCYPFVQVMVTALVGTGVAGLFALSVGWGIDIIFALPHGGGALCLLRWADYVLAGGAVLLLSLVAAVQPACAAARVEPALVVREL